MFQSDPSNPSITTYKAAIYSTNQILSIIILIPYIFLFSIYIFKTHLQTLNHKLTFQLCLSSFFFSLSFLFNSSSSGTFTCKLQGFLSTFGQFCSLFFTVSISIITFISYKNSPFLKSNHKLILITTLLIWMLSLLFSFTTLSHIEPSSYLSCRSSSRSFQVAYFALLLLFFIVNMAMLTYVKVLIKHDLTDECELDKYPQYVKKINIQIIAQVAIYVLYGIWIIVDRGCGGSNDMKGYEKGFYAIAEIGECLTGIVIPLAYGINKEVWKYFVNVISCNKEGDDMEESVVMSELHIAKENEREKRVSMIDASNIRNLSQFGEDDDL